MSGFTDKLRKAAKMEPGVLLRKLLSFDNVCLIAWRRFEEDRSLPASCIAGRKADGSYMDTGAEFIPIGTSRRYWYADPSVFNHEGRTWLFAEAFDKHELIGRIACTELTGETTKEPVEVLREDFHLSFPQVFSWNSDIFMLPETSTDSSVRLYRAKDFPWSWECAARLPVDIPLVDTVITDITDDSITILTSEVGGTREYDYRYHRYIIQRDGNGSYSMKEDDTFVKSRDFTHFARNGGSVFDDAATGKRLVATQWSTDTVYGAGLDFVEYDPSKSADDLFSGSVLKISPADLDIRGFKGIRHGGRKALGTHSYDRDSSYEVIDVIYLEFTPLKYIRRLIRGGGAI